MAKYTMVNVAKVTWLDDEGKVHTETYGNERTALERVRDLQSHFGRQPVLTGARRKAVD